MRSKQLMFCLAILCLPSLGAARMSEIVCDDSARLKSQLAAAEGSQMQGQGMRDPDTLVEVWVDPRTGAWTLLQQYTNGTACVIAMGEHWEAFSAEQDPSG